MRRTGRALIGATLLIIAAAATAHPDLVIQIEALTSRLAETPDNGELLMKRGDLYRRHQDYIAATRDFDRVEEITPGEPLLDFYRGRLQQETGHPDQADFLLGRYLEHSPEQASAWKLRGEVNLSLNDPARSVDYFSRAISLSHTPSPELFRLLVMAEIAAGESHWNTAMNRVEQGLDLFGLEVTLLGLGTDIALAAGQPARADEWIDRLPSKLMVLPQWEERAELLECFMEAPEPTCQVLATARLRRQSEVFLLSYGASAGIGK